MSRVDPQSLAMELRVRVQALANAVRAGRVPGVDPQTPGDLVKVASAADRFTEKWRALLVSDPADDARQQRHDLRTPVSHILGYLELAEEALAEGAEKSVELDAWIAEVQRLRGRADELHAALEVGLRAHAASAPNSRPASRPATTRSATGDLLVVDDDEHNRALLQRHLERQGYAVRTAAGGAQGLSLARERAPDLVLLDVLMPELDGYETLRQLKTDEKLCRVPVIMLSGLDHAETVVRCLEAGADDHVPKPVEPAILGARVVSSLERKRLGDREREYMSQLLAAKRRADAFIDYVVPMGARLASQTDAAALLEDIVSAAQRFTGADGGTLYLKPASGGLQPVVRTVGSLEGSLEGSWVGGDAAHVGAPTAVAMQVAQDGSSVLVHDVAACKQYDHSASRRFDEAQGYTTRSLFVVALRDADERVRGVLELSNAGARFDPTHQRALESLGTLAAVALGRSEHEQALQARIAALEVQVDTTARAREVAVITESEYFQTLRHKASQMRARARAAQGPGSTEAGGAPGEAEASASEGGGS